MTTAPSEPPSVELSQLQEAWQRTILPAVEQKSIPTASMLREAHPSQLDEDRLTVEFPAAASFHRQLAEEPKNATLLADALYEVTGRKLALDFAVGENGGDDSDERRRAACRRGPDHPAHEGQAGRPGGRRPVSTWPTRPKPPGREALKRGMRVGMVEHVERLVRLGGELEVGAVPSVRDGDRQLVRRLMPEEHDLDAVDLAVGELSMRFLCRGWCWSWCSSRLGDLGVVESLGARATPIHGREIGGRWVCAIALEVTCRNLGQTRPRTGRHDVSMDMNKMMQQVQQLQAQMEQAQEELKNETVEASAGGGMVTVKATGDLQITEIKIAPEAIDPDDPEMLSDMVLAAVNEALRSAQALAQSKLGGMSGLGDLGGMGLPGL